MARSTYDIVIIGDLRLPGATGRAVAEEIRAQARAGYRTALLQVHLSTPVEVCVDRDVKGLYAKAFRGEISSMTGVDDPYEIPADPDLRIDTSAVDRDVSVALLLDLLAERGLG